MECVENWFSFYEGELHKSWLFLLNIQLCVFLHSLHLSPSYYRIPSLLSILAYFTLNSIQMVEKRQYLFRCFLNNKTVGERERDRET